MNYLFETEYFLFRKRIPEDIGCFPGPFPEENLIRCPLKQDSGFGKSAPDGLIIQFRPTGALAGEVAIRGSAGSPEDAETLCCLCREFRRKRFEAEIVDALNTIL